MDEQITEIDRIEDGDVVLVAQSLWLIVVVAQWKGRERPDRRSGCAACLRVSATGKDDVRQPQEPDRGFVAGGVCASTDPAHASLEFGDSREPALVGPSDLTVFE